MKPVLVSRIDGSFEGFADGRVFRLSNGLRWRQVGEITDFAQGDRPRARLFHDGDDFFLDVEGTTAMIRVELAGSIRSSCSADLARRASGSLLEV
jgi:hypothetical protein